MAELAKIWAAMWVPTDAEGRLMKDAMKRHLRFLIEKKVGGIFVGGSTGEFPYLDIETRNELLRFVVEHAGHLQIIANISHISPRGVLKLAEYAKQFKLTAISLLPPLYYPFAQDDIAEHFVRAAEHFKQPLWLYNFPELAGKRIEIDTIDKIAKRVPVLGFKQSGGDFAYLIPLLAEAKKNKFSVYTGNDFLLPEALALGAHGCIGGLVSGIPEILVDSFDPQKREACSAKLTELLHLMAPLPYPINFGALVEARGFEVGASKIALSTPSAETYKKMVEQIRHLLRKWGLL